MTVQKLSFRQVAMKQMVEPIDVKPGRHNYQLKNTPLDDTVVQVYLNGIMQALHRDYVFEDRQLTFIYPPLTTDFVQVIYWMGTDQDA